jgi:hypothetical protein
MEYGLVSNGTMQAEASTAALAATNATLHAGESKRCRAMKEKDH